MKRPRAILIDLDDTIIDDSGKVESAWQDVCAETAAAVGTLDASELLAAILRVRDWYWSDPDRHREGRQDLRAASTRIVHEALISLDHDDGDLARAIAHAYRDRRDAATNLFPGAIEVLEDVARRGIRLGLITNGAGPAQRAKIERFDLARHFHAILIEGEFGVGKPNERIYQAALEAVGAAPSDAWMVGDNLEWEVIVPGRLGLSTVWVDRRGTGLPPNSPAQPDRIIVAIRQLSELLASAES